jgi:hypothetical protein
LCECRNIRGVNGEDRATRIYQWLYRRASFFRSESSGRGATRTVRTEVTVERQGTTVMLGNVGVGFDTCPFCGSKLTSEQVEQARLRLPKGPISA